MSKVTTKSPRSRSRRKGSIQRYETKKSGTRWRYQLWVPRDPDYPDLGMKKHNLKGVTVNIPLGLLTCVTGVSGSGKSTLVLEVLFHSLSQLLYHKKPKINGCKELKGVDALDKIIDIDQSPIGRTPRSNPATYTGLFTFIRDLFSNLPESRVRGY